MAMGPIEGKNLKMFGQCYIRLLSYFVVVNIVLGNF